MSTRKIALCMAIYKGMEPEVGMGLTDMAFALGRHTTDEFALFPAIRKRSELAANYALDQMEHCEKDKGIRFTHVIWMDDDIVVGGNGIRKLLASIDDDHPVVFSLAFERDGQHKPGIWKSLDLDGEHINVEQIFDYPEDELIPVYAGGLCCAAWDREVLTAIKKPYFDWLQPGFQRNSHTPDGYFCGRLHDAGIPVHCHTGVKVGHMSYPYIVDETIAETFRPKWTHTEHER